MEKTKCLKKLFSDFGKNTEIKDGDKDDINKYDEYMNKIVKENICGNNTCDKKLRCI